MKRKVIKTTWHNKKWVTHEVFEEPWHSWFTGAGETVRYSNQFQVEHKPGQKDVPVLNQRFWTCVDYVGRVVPPTLQRHLSSLAMAAYNTKYVVTKKDSPS